MAVRTRESTEGRRDRRKALDARIASKRVIGPAYGLAKGLSVTLRTMFRRSVTQQYPHTKPSPPPRSRGVIALKQENCTVCMLCARECPDWCIYIESHKEVMPPKTPGARARTRNILDRFAIDFALCMYCGICVEVCPFDALFWAPNFEYSEFDISKLTHEMPKLGGWMDSVQPPPELEEGADPPKESAAPRKVYGPAVSPVSIAQPATPKSAKPAAPAAPAPAAAAAAPGPAAPAPAPAAEAPAAHEALEIDQEVYQRELAAGQPERVARAMAKKAAVLKRKRAGGAPPPAAAPAETPAEAPTAHEAPDIAQPDTGPGEAPGGHEIPDIDQEVYQRELAAGQPERVARAMAKKAWVLKKRRGG